MMRNVRQARNVIRPVGTAVPGPYYLVTAVDAGRTNYDLDRTNNVKVGRKVVVR